MKSKGRSGVVRLMRSWKRKDVGWWWQQQAHSRHDRPRRGRLLSSSASATKNWPFPLYKKKQRGREGTPVCVVCVVVVCV